MTITGIRPAKHGRIAVEADDAYLLSVHPDAWAGSGLSVGDPVTEEGLEALAAESACFEARNKALRMLSSRSYTRRTLTERLSRSFGEEAARRAADRMEELGLIDDARYAARYARELSEDRAWAPRRIRCELIRKGVDRETADAALEELGDRDELGAAVALLEKKYRQLTDEKEIRRAAALLERRGYGGDVIRTAIHAVRRLPAEGSE